MRILLVAAMLVLTAVAHAGPSLTVRAHTEIRLKPIRKIASDTYVVSGTLVDRFSGEGLAGQELAITIAGGRHSAWTDGNGAFEVRVPAPGGRQDIAVRFEGHHALDPARVDLDDVDIDKNPVELSLSTAAEPGGVRITVGAESGGAEIPLPIALFVGPADADPRDLDKVAALTAGGPPFVLTRAAAGGPGERRVRAVFGGDDLYGAASIDATVELATTTATSLALGDGGVAFEDDVVATGKVLDEDQAGVAKASVALMASGRRIAQAVTKEDGAFRFSVEARVLGQGKHALQAVVEPTEGWMRASRSEVRHVEIAAPQPVPVSYTIAAFAITAVVALGFLAARSQPWQKLRRGARDEGERSPAEAPAEPSAGLVPARPSLVSTLRRPGDHGVTGVVRDAIRHRALPGARIALRRSGTQEVLEARVGADGGFGFENLVAGDWRVEVGQRAHVTETFTITVPHRGELRGARVDLMPVRERIFSLYKRAALPLLPDPARWGVWSPRQVFEHVRARKPAAALATLTDFVEAAYFAAALPDEDRLPEAEARVEAALREQAQAMV